MKETATLSKRIASLSAPKTDRHALGRPLSTGAERTKASCMQQATCTRVQPRYGHAPSASTPLRPLSGGARIAWYNMHSSSCYSMSSAARRRLGTKLGPCLFACSPIMPRSGARARRRIVTRCRLAGVNAPVVCGERAGCDDSAHSCCGSRWNGQLARAIRAQGRTRAASPTHRPRRPREHGLTPEMRRRLPPANSHAARLMRKSRLLPRNQVQEGSWSKPRACGEEPPPSGGRAVSEPKH